MLHSEALFFIDDQKPHIFEFHRFCQKRMGTNNDIHRAIFDPVARDLRLCSPHKAGQLTHFDRKASEPFCETLRMLARKQGRWCNQGHLHTRQCGSKGCTHCNFCFPKPYITANKPIHGNSRHKIPHHVFDGSELIIRFLIRKPRAEGIPHPRWRLKDRRAAQSPLSCDANQTIRHILDTLFKPRFLGLPRPTAKPIQQSFFMPIFAEQLYVFHRQIETRIFCIDKQKTFMRRPRSRNDF